MQRSWPIPSSDRPFSTTREGRTVAELAARQHGVVSLRQLRELGVDSSTARGWVACGRLIRLHHGVYAVGHSLLRSEGFWLAGVLACGEGAVLSHRSAAGLWAIRPTSSSRIEVTAPRRTGRSRPGLRVHRARLVSDEVTSEDAIPCTTASRTLIDLGAVLDRRGVERAVEAAERLRLLDLRSLGLLMARHRGRAGTARLREVLAQFDPLVLRARSELEARFIRLCTDRGIPAPIVNGPIEAPGEELEVDFHWPGARLVVETDGDAFHRTTAARARDAHRDEALSLAGWTVRRCGWHDVVVDPAPLVADLACRLARGRFRPR